MDVTCSAADFSGQEADSGYFSPIQQKEDNAEEERYQRRSRFSFDNCNASPESSPRSSRKSDYGISDSQVCVVDIDMRRSAVYQRRRRSLSDPFPRSSVQQHKASMILSVADKSVQTCESFSTTAVCRCTSCAINNGTSALPVRPVAVIPPSRINRLAAYANATNDRFVNDLDEQRQLLVENFAGRLRRMADRFDRDFHRNDLNNNNVHHNRLMPAGFNIVFNQLPAVNFVQNVIDRFMGIFM